MTDRFNNPYAPPSAVVQDTGRSTGRFLPGGRKVPAGNGFTWISSAWSLFKEAPGEWIVLVILLLVAGFLIGLVGQFAMRLLPIHASTSPLYTILMPLFSGGVVIAAANQHRDGVLSIEDAFANLRQKMLPLLLIGLLSLGVSAGADYLLDLMFTPLEANMIISALSSAMVKGTQPPDIVIMLVKWLGLRMLISMAIGCLIYTALWFVPALIVLNDTSPVAALKTSFQVCVRNWLAILLYSLLVIVLFILACIPLLFGLIVLLPVLCISSYTSYRDIFIET